MAVTDSGALDNGSGVIGRIPQGQEGFDIHDIRAYASVAKAPVAVIAVKGEDWGDKAGEYFSDYRAPGKSRQVWDFTVVSKNPNADITLFWNGLNVITQNDKGSFETQLDNQNRVLWDLHLIDLETGQIATRGVTKSGELPTYTFNMNGVKERAFRWVNKEPEAEDFSLVNVATLNSVSPSRVGEALGDSVRSFSGETAPRAGFSGPPALGTVPAQRSTIAPVPGQSKTKQ
jgi:hypothetical protein